MKHLETGECWWTAHHIVHVAKCEGIASERNPLFPKLCNETSEATELKPTIETFVSKRWMSGSNDIFIWHWFIRIKYANFALHRLEDCCARKTASFHAIQFSTQSLHMVLALPDFTFCTWRNVRSMRDLRLQSISGFNSCFCSLPLGVVLGWGHLESLNWGKIPLSYARLKGPRVPSRCWKVYLSMFNCKWRASLRSTSYCSFAGNLTKTIVRQTIQIEKADEPGKSQECQKMQWGWW